MGRMSETIWYVREGVCETGRERDRETGTERQTVRDASKFRDGKSVGDNMVCVRGRERESECVCVREREGE